MYSFSPPNQQKGVQQSDLTLEERSCTGRLWKVRGTNEHRVGVRSRHGNCDPLDQILQERPRLSSDEGGDNLSVEVCYVEAKEGSKDEEGRVEDEQASFLGSPGGDDDPEQLGKTGVEDGVDLDGTVQGSWSAISNLVSVDGWTREERARGGQTSTLGPLPARLLLPPFGCRPTTTSPFFLPGKSTPLHVIPRTQTRRDAVRTFWIAGRLEAYELDRRARRGCWRSLSRLEGAGGRSDIVAR